jgi:23S rRNA (guanosine2251-2'-O)-methyltransferase
MSDIIAGRNAVREALRGARTIQKVFVQEGTHGGSLSDILKLCEAHHLPVERVPKERLDRLAGSVRHQGVAAQGAPVAFRDLDEVLAQVREKGETPLLLMLDELQDPQNVGALIRTANSAGVHGVLLPQRRSCPLNAVVAKISAGAVEYEPVISIGNMVRTMKKLKQEGFWIVGADMDGKDLYFDADLTGPILLVVGAEGKGLGRLVKENCDFIVRIPMLGQVQSLNASVAGGILLYDIVRQRQLVERKR